MDFLSYILKCLIRIQFLYSRIRNLEEYPKLYFKYYNKK